MIITETSIRAALSEPELFADELVKITNNRGHRDAAVVIAARSGNWEQLRTAATVAGHTANEGGGSITGPFVTFAIASWVMGELPADYVAMLASIPATDPAHRMASLLVKSQRTVPATEWASRMATIDIADCLAFAGSQAQA